MTFEKLEQNIDFLYNGKIELGSYSYVIIIVEPQLSVFMINHANCSENVYAPKVMYKQYIVHRLKIINNIN